MSSDITLQKQKEVWRGRDQIIEIKVIGEGPGRILFFTAILLLGPIPNEWERQFKLGCSNQGGM